MRTLNLTRVTLFATLAAAAALALSGQAMAAPRAAGQPGTSQPAVGTGTLRGVSPIPTTVRNPLPSAVNAK